MIAQVGDGGGECSSFVDGVFVDTYHEGRGVVEGFFDFEVETFVDDAFYGALGEAESRAMVLLLTFLQYSWAIICLNCSLDRFLGRRPSMGSRKRWEQRDICSVLL